MAFLDEIASRIEDEGAGTLGVDLFLSSSAQIPNGDGPYVTVIETSADRSSNAPLLTYADDGTIERPDARIAIFAESYTVARQKAVDVYLALGGDNGLFNISLSGTFYPSIIARTQIKDGGLDVLRRACVRFAIRARRTLAAVTPAAIPAFSGSAFSQSAFRVTGVAVPAFSRSTFSAAAFDVGI